MSQTYYITTPIYYVNDYPHIGHAYTTVAADVAARFQRLKGRPTYFLTGTDEHGEKVEKAAKANNETPIQLADRVVERFKKLWDVLHIDHDDFIRTTEERHEQGVEKFYRKVHAKGDIYLDKYEGWYCVPDETFWTETQLVDGKCPECSREVKLLSEESYFFRMSKYQDALLQHIKDNPDFIQPVSKRNEVINFIEQGLKDLSISRTSFSWGVPVPDDDKHVIYVWFDALTNYITAIDYLNEGNPFKTNWPAAVHLVGKDILRFHAIYWPTFLMAADLPLPQQVYAHGWWTHEGQKMSKSKGNFVDPFDICETYGVDAFRYFLLREFPFGLDGDFSKRAFEGRINSDLANDLGNLASRTLAMVHKYCGGKVPENHAAGDMEAKLQTTVAKAIGEFEAHLNKLEFDASLKALWSIMSTTNRYIDDKAPWALAKDESKKGELHTVLYTLVECLRVISILLWPFMPNKANELRERISQHRLDRDSLEGAWASATTWSETKAGTDVIKGNALFPRLET